MCTYVSCKESTRDYRRGSTGDCSGGKDGRLVLTSEVTHIVSVCVRGQRYACASVCVCVNARISMVGVSALRLGVVRAGGRVKYRFVLCTYKTYSVIPVLYLHRPISYS